MIEGLQILPGTQEHYQEILSLYNEGFLAKYRFIISDSASAAAVVHDFALVDLKSREKEYVAVLGGKIVGIVSLRFSEQEKQQRPNLPLHRLHSRYGLRGLLRAAFIGMIINHRLDQDELYIDSLVVSSEARGQGIGTALLSFARDTAYAKGKSRLTLYVMKENIRAKALYERFGFQEHSFHHLRWLRRSSGYSGAYFMEMGLKQVHRSEEGS